MCVCEVRAMQLASGCDTYVCTTRTGHTQVRMTLWVEHDLWEALPGRTQVR